MAIIQKPTGLSFAGNIGNIVIASETDIAFILSVDGTDILNELYSPVAGKITVSLKDVVSRYLILSVPDYNTPVMDQPEAVKTFTAIVGEETITFDVIKGGVDGTVDFPVFLTQNFLTWQPQQKNIILRQPEWLNYYAATARVLVIKAYFPDQTTALHTISLPAGKVTSINTSYDTVNNYFSGDVSYYDVWVEESGSRLTYVQRYVPVPETDSAEIYVFENSLGGLDSFICIGELTEKISTEGTLTTQFDKTLDSSIDLSVSYEQKTGILRLDESRWLRDFFISQQRYHVSDDGLKKIYIEEQDNKFKVQELNTFTFEFFYCNQTFYNKIIRNREVLPELLEFPEPDGLFFLTPRLSEYPATNYADDLLIPVQHPYTGKWMQLAASLFTPNATVDINLATYTHAGLASFSNEHFTVENGHVSIKNPASDAPVCDFSKYFYEKDGKLFCRLDLIGEKEMTAYGVGPGGSSSGGWDLIDNVVSDRTDAGLTANMGRYLKTLIDEKASDWASITGKPSVFPPAAHSHSEYAPYEHTHEQYFEISVWEKYFYEKEGKLFCRLDLIGEKEMAAYGVGPGGNSPGGWDLIDNVVSDRADAGLTANMGRYLKTLIDEKASDWPSITGKPSVFPPASHIHMEYAPYNHTHEQYFEISAWEKYFYEKDGKLFCRLDLIGEKEIAAYGVGPGGSPSVGWDLINNLTSDRTDAGLTANMGRYLKTLIDEKASDWASITGKPSVFPSAAHSHSEYLPLVGGTMTGNLKFTGGSSICIKNHHTSNATGISWLNQAATDTIAGIGCHTIGDSIESLYMGWTNSPWQEPNSLSVSASKIRYRGYDIWHKGNVGVGSGLNADLLDGYHRDNLYTGVSNFIKIIGNEKSIIVTGDANTYYPVVITGLTGKTIPNIVSVYKDLGSITPSTWIGNHSNGTSSCYYIYEFRSTFWDGNGGYLKTLRAWYGYAPVNAHVSYSTKNNGGLIVWLRGGGAQYYIACNNPFNMTDYYTRTNIGNNDYPEYIESRTTVGNSGILTNIPLYGNISGSASSLATSRTLWGQPFDGSANVSGSITGATDIIGSGTIQGGAVRGANLVLQNTDEFNSATGGNLHIGYRSTGLVTIGNCCNVSVGAFRTPAFKLDVAGDLIVDRWLRTRGVAGWYSQTYSGGIYMEDTTYVRVYNNKRFYVSNAESYSMLTEGGFTRQGYGGASWGNGHGALNIAISNNSAQTPLIVAYRAGQTPSIVGGNRLFSLELLNAGTTMCWMMGGAKKFEFTSSGNFLAVGEVTAYTASDMRLKENIRPLDGLSYLRRLKFYEFDWNATARELTKDNRRHGFGGLAHEFKNVLPDLVGNIYNSGYLGIRYEKLIPFLGASVIQINRAQKAQEKRIAKIERILNVK